MCPGAPDKDMESMKVMVNGEERVLERSLSLTEFLAQHRLNAKMVVVEHNRVIVPRERYDTVSLQDQDELEIVQMMAGG
jgi:sulfur carrier protein